MKPPKGTQKQVERQQLEATAFPVSLIRISTKVKPIGKDGTKSAKRKISYSGGKRQDLQEIGVQAGFTNGHNAASVANLKQSKCIAVSFFRDDYSATVVADDAKSMELS